MAGIDPREQPAEAFTVVQCVAHHLSERHPPPATKLKGIAMQLPFKPRVVLGDPVVFGQSMVINYFIPGPECDVNILEECMAL